MRGRRGKQSAIPSDQQTSAYADVLQHDLLNKEIIKKSSVDQKLLQKIVFASSGDRHYNFQLQPISASSGPLKLSPKDIPRLFLKVLETLFWR